MRHLSPEAEQAVAARCDEIRAEAHAEALELFDLLRPAAAGPADTPRSRLTPGRLPASCSPTDVPRTRGPALHFGGQAAPRLHALLPARPALSLYRH
jgi:hypothetical protein